LLGWGELFEMFRYPVNKGFHPADLLF